MHRPSQSEVVGRAKTSGHVQRGLSLIPLSRPRTKVGAADPETVIGVLGGGMRVGNYLPMRTFELVVHGFDISTSSGTDASFSPAVLADAAALAARIAVALGERRTVLGALTGRQQLPDGFSIVA